MEIQFNGYANKSGVYKIINKINGRFYIGSTKRFKQRVREHLKSLRKNKHHNKFLQNDFNKCGEENFQFHIVEVIEGEQNVRLIAEQRQIDSLFDEQINCYNIQKNTQNHTMVFSKTPEQTRKLISQKSKLMWENRTLEEKNKIAKKISNGHKGKKLSKEHIEKFSKSLKGRSVWNKGRVCSPEECSKMSKVFYEKIFTEQWSAKQRKARLGRKDSPQTIENKRNGSKSKKAIIAINLESQKSYAFPSIASASKILKVRNSAIYKILKGISTKTNGWSFRRPLENEVPPGTRIKLPNIQDIAKFAGG